VLVEIERKLDSVIDLVDFCVDRAVMRCLIKTLGRVVISSRLTTQRTGMPSLRSRATSTGIFRMVRVPGATAIAARTRYAASRLKSTAGRLPAVAYQPTTLHRTSAARLGGQAHLTHDDFESEKATLETTRPGRPSCRAARVCSRPAARCPLRAWVSGRLLRNPVDSDFNE